MVRLLRRLGPLVGVGLSLVSPAVHAQSANEAAATALFDEGRKLMGEHRWAEACPKLAESQRLAPSGGTLLNLADCYEHAGQTASAWASWKDAAARANAAGKADVERRALARATALEPSLAKLTIAVNAGSEVDGLEVKRDGVDVGHAEFGTSIPVDPGVHVVVATAPRKKPFSAKVDVSAKQTDARVMVTLEDEPQVVAPLPPAPASAVAPLPNTPPPAFPIPEETGGSAQRTIGIVVGVAGLAGLGVGGGFGLLAKSKNDQALQNCRTATLCNSTGLSLTDDAKSAATVSTVAFIAGGALVAGGFVLWLTAPRSSRTGMRVSPFVGASTGGISVDGAF
jgi:hypothetical protein